MLKFIISLINGTTFFKAKRNNKNVILDDKIAAEMAKKISEDAKMHRKIRESS